MRKLLGCLIILGAAGSGCTYISGAQSVQGRAYVVRNEWVSSSYWNCDATSGEPVCYQTHKQPLAKK
jgi:hypothetical protein